MLLFVTPLIMGHELGWPLWGWASLAGSAAFLAAFTVVERRVAASGGRPLISPRVLRAPLLVPACVAVVFAPGSWGSFLFTTTLHLQGDLALSPLESGLAFVPCVTAFALVGLNWQRLPARWHGRAVPAASPSRRRATCGSAPSPAAACPTRRSPWSSVPGSA